MQVVTAIRSWKGQGRVDNAIPLRKSSADGKKINIGADVCLIARKCLQEPRNVFTTE